MLYDYTYNFSSLDVEHDFVGRVSDMLDGVVPRDTPPVPAFDTYIHTIGTVPGCETLGTFLLYVVQ